MADKIFYAMYDDDDVLKKSAKKVVAAGVKVKEVFSPFPVHGLDGIIGVRNTRLGIMSFLYGLTGLTIATMGMRYFMIQDWPMNIGGKPNGTYLENALAFIPISFEMTVLFAAHGLALTYFLRNKILPGIPASNPHPRTTDDRFVMEIRLSDNSDFSDGQIQELLNSTELVELDRRDI